MAYSIIILSIALIIMLELNSNNAVGSFYNIIVKASNGDSHNWLVSAPMVEFSSGSANMSNMMSGMMKAPQDAIIKVESSPIIPVGKESEIKLLVLDKNTQKPMTGAQVIIGIERGAAMTTMDMMGPMFQAQEQNKGSGLYVITFMPDNKGIYTLHTHVVPPGEPMYSMMNNHMDIGIVPEDNKSHL
jgi:hypothetical protein